MNSLLGRDRVSQEVERLRGEHRPGSSLWFSQNRQAKVWGVSLGLANFTDFRSYLCLSDTCLGYSGVSDGDA